MAVIVILPPRAAGFLLHFVLEMSCFFAREHCVTHKINALDDFVTTVWPAVRDISLCFRSLRHSAAHVVPCSHMGFKHRTRAGAAIVQKHWRGNKHKQHALSCLEVSLVPMDLCCAITLCSAPHAQQPNPKPKPPNGADRPPPLPPVEYSICSFQPAGGWNHAVINGQAAWGGEGFLQDCFV